MCILLLSGIGLYRCVGRELQLDANAVLDIGEVQNLEGLSKKQVQSILGLPYNSLDEDVWIWSFDMTRPTTIVSWREFEHSGALFLVFVDGKTIKGLRSTAASSPQEVFSSKFGVDESEVPDRFRYTE
jgi:hypothetical protein